MTVCGDTVIEVHNTQSGPKQKLYYHQGTLQGATISNFHQKGIEFQEYDNSVLSTSCCLTTQDWLVVTVTGGPFEGVMIWYYTEADLGGSLQSKAQGYVAGGVNSDVVLVNGTGLEMHTPNTGLSFNAQYSFLTPGTLDWSGDGSIFDEGTNTNIEGGNPYISVAGPFLVMTYMTLDATGSTMAVYGQLP